MYYTENNPVKMDEIMKSICGFVLPVILSLILIGSFKTVHADTCTQGVSGAKMQVLYHNQSHSSSYPVFAQGTNGIVMAPSIVTLLTPTSAMSYENTTPICVGKLYTFKAFLFKKPAHPDEKPEILVQADWSIIFTNTSGEFKNTSSQAASGFTVIFSNGVVTVTTP